MIPKIIHYTWFSDEPFPDEIRKCIDSWHNYLPEYEFKLWDYNSVKSYENIFLNEALLVKKWAFASDYVRLFAVYNEGGIYLDTDVLLKKSFNDLLNFPCFIGQESSFHMVGREIPAFLTSHCFGAEKNNRFIKNCLDYYSDRHFIQSSAELPNELKYDMTLLPYIQAFIAKQKGWDWSFNNKQIFENDEFVVLPSCFFDGNSENSDTYCKHLALGSWRESRISQEKISIKYKLKWRIVKVLEIILNKLGYIIIKTS